jgi:peptidoglycan/xylan/chitin deacetylase (PgdA/CDA1 family)
MFDVTLSFDNGPEPEVTPAVLDVLARAGARSTFFVVGEKLARDRRRMLSERAAAEGHWIGNHTWTHSVPLGECCAATAEREIDETQRAIGALAHPDRLFRPFGRGGAIGRHLLSRAAAEHLAEGGYTCVLWNAIPRDWADPEGWAATALDQCAAQPWSLVVLHDLPTGAMAHLERFIAAVRERGGRFRQDFPPDCVPMRRGTALPGFEAIVAASVPSAAPSTVRS